MLVTQFHYLPETNSSKQQITIIRRSPEHDVKIANQLTGLRIRQRLEVAKDEFAVNEIASSVEDVVGLVPRVTSNKQLRREEFPIALLDLVVNVGARSTRIRNRLDRAKAILSGGCRLELPKALKVLVLLTGFRPTVASVQIHRVGIALPDLNGDAFGGLPFGVQHPADEMRDFPDGWSDVVVDDQKIVILIEW